jgi:hypothetical protein
LTLIQVGRRGFCAGGTAKGPFQAGPGRNMGLAFLAFLSLIRAKSSWEHGANVASIV